MIKKLLFTVIVALLFVPIVDAATLNVNSATGNDSTCTKVQNAAGSCTWATLGRAMWGNATRTTPNVSEAATAGDTVLVNAGTYTAPDTGIYNVPAFNPVNTGTSDSNRITIKAVGTVNLYTTGTSGGPVIGAGANKNYVTWDGFTIDESNYTMSSMGELGMVMFGGGNTGGLVKNCTLIGAYQSASDSNKAAVWFHGATSARAYNNTISNITASGTNVAAFYTYAATNCIWDHNNISDSDGALFIKGNIDTTVNTGNVFKFNKVTGLIKFGARLGGTGGDANQDNHIYQNLFYANPSARILFTSYSSYTGNVFANNTIYNAKAAYIYGSTYSSQTVRYYNNLVHTVVTSVAYTEDWSDSYPSDYDFQHNSYYGAPAGTWWVERDGGAFAAWTTWIGAEPWNQDNVSPASTNGIDPLLANISGLDFRLCTAAGVPHASCSGASPALTLGVDILDLDGDGSTTDTIPAGAYITGNETIGIESATPPSKVMGVSGSSVESYMGIPAGNIDWP